MKNGYGRRIKLFLDNSLPPHLLLGFKALLLYILFSYKWLLVSSESFPFLPFLAVLDVIPSFFYTALIFILFTAIFLSFLKIRSYRFFSLLSGSIVLFLILSSKLFFSNSLTLVACLLILIGLCRKNDYLFRIQIALLYIGASTNKMIDPDWWNGNYFDFFLRDIFDVNLYQTWIPKNSLTLAKWLGIATIFSEFILGMAVLIPKITRITITLGLIFHISMLAVTSGQLSIIFFYIMCAAFLLVSGVQFQSLTLSTRYKILLKGICYIDFSDSIVVKYSSKDTCTLFTDNEHFSGWKAIKKMLFSKQMVLSSFFILLMVYMQKSFISDHIIHPLLYIF